jgi:hypothetical protein
LRRALMRRGSSRPHPISAYRPRVSAAPRRGWAQADDGRLEAKRAKAYSGKIGPAAGCPRNSGTPLRTAGDFQNSAFVCATPVSLLARCPKKVARRERRWHWCSGAASVMSRAVQDQICHGHRVSRGGYDACDERDRALGGRPERRTRNQATGGASPRGSCALALDGRSRTLGQRSAPPAETCGAA